MGLTMNDIDASGRNSGIWAFGTVVYTNLIVVVTLVIAVETL